MSTVNNYHHGNNIIRYEETTYNLSISNAYNHLIHELAYSNNRLRAEGIRPCYATIAPASLEKWNQYRLSRGKTGLLLHEGRYPQMQEDLTTVLSKINGFICKLNIWNEMYTPYVAGTVVRTKCPGGQMQRILQYHKLFDGVHADDKTITEWADKMKKAILKNRSDHQRMLHMQSSLNARLDDDLLNKMIYGS